MSQSLATQSEAPQKTRVGPYRLESSLGAGGMGEVYKAIDERLDRPVAIKRILPDRRDRERTRQRFRLEAQAVAALNHPAIVKVYDLVCTDEADWLVMELIDGRPLSDLVLEGPLPTDVALPLFKTLAEALVQAHDAGILHRDLKTSNVMVTSEGRAKLLDFGLVKKLEPFNSEPALTSEGRLIGTPRSMSPEQALGEELDVRSDLFSFGILAYETLSGENPFHARQALRTLHRICFHVQPPVRTGAPSVPIELSDLIDRLLEKDRHLRPDDARELLRQLEAMSQTDSLPLTGQHSESQIKTSFGDSTRAIFRTETGFSESSPAAKARTSSRFSSQRFPFPRPSASRRYGSSTGDAVTGERRHVTILHCELTSANDSQILDPEDLIEIRPIFHRMAESVARDHEGRLDDLLDYGFRLCFDSASIGQDVERALAAARAVIARTSEWSQQGLFAEERPAVRVGIHSGPVVCAVDGAGEETLSYGDTGVVAAAVQRLGVTNSIMISEAAREWVAEVAPVEALPPALMPGLSKPLVAYRVSDEPEAAAAGS